MKCICSGNQQLTSEPIRFDSIIVGQVIIKNIEHWCCDVCNEIYYKWYQSDVLIKAVRKLEKAEIMKQPLEDFITSSETSEILEISKQALSKNPRINRGMIMWVTMGNVKLFLHKSVELYKETGKGTYLLKVNK